MSLLTEDIRALIGQSRVYIAPEEMGAAAGRYFGLATGDDNPLYSDPQYAERHGLTGATLPLTLICETNQYAGLPMDRDGYAGHVWQIEVPHARKLRGGNRYTFYRRIRPGDRITATWTITGASEKRTSAGADMLIISSSAVYSNQDGERLAENEETIIFVGSSPQ